MVVSKPSKKQIAYREYLRSEHWLLLRDRVIERDGFTCNGCGSHRRLDVHHLVYRDPLESARLEDLVTLCKTCHRIEHHRRVRFPIHFALAYYERLLVHDCEITEEQWGDMCRWVLVGWDREECIGKIRLYRRYRLKEDFKTASANAVRIFNQRPAAPDLGLGDSCAFASRRYGLKDSYDKHLDTPLESGC